MAASSNDSREKNGQATQVYKIVHSNDQIIVTCPYNEQFVNTALVLGGEWNDRTERWQFPLGQQPAVEKLCKNAFAEKKPPFIIQELGNHVFVTCPRSDEFTGIAQSIGGRWNKEDKQWQFPREQKSTVEKLCAHAFAEKGMKTAYHIGKRGDKIIAHVPFNKDFVEMARATGGKYSPKTKTWTFDASQRPVVQQMCEYAFEGKVSRPKMSRIVKEALRRTVARALKPADIALGGLGKAGNAAAVFTALGMGGLKGVYALQQVKAMFEGIAGKGSGVTRIMKRPKLGPKGVDYGPMNMGGQEFFMERMREGLAR
ncbi:MAG: hypothetical protein F4Z16_06545 [Rhodothermaceae bacterium]|nr:hypothetical protein [Rhodothermaceae bacterium]MYD66857.1 hypothetical protein [Rhodothermaceae bacterium]MYI78148.1 hypothetical protein [Gammaproteobacteria bacterium]